MEGKEMNFVGKEGFKVKSSRTKPVEKEGKEEEKKETSGDEVLVFPSDHFGIVGKFELKE